MSENTWKKNRILQWIPPLSYSILIGVVAWLTAGSKPLLSMLPIWMPATAGIVLGGIIAVVCSLTAYNKEMPPQPTSGVSQNNVTMHVRQLSGEMADLARQTSTSIDEITRSSQAAMAFLNEAQSCAERSASIVKSLSGQTQSVTELVSAITSISEQTNLLALNATIESARAGEAGRGFSVVANEVKQLANDTRQTSEKVIDRVRGIQTSSSETVDSAESMLSLMRQCTSAQAAIASALEEQRAIASQLARQAESLESQTLEDSSLARRRAEIDIFAGTGTESLTSRRRVLESVSTRG